MSSTIENIQQPKLTESKTQVNKGAMNLAASWYVAMHSKDLGEQPKAIELFGRSLVAWRDQKGHPVIMEPYCSHMGINLAIGKLDFIQIIFAGYEFSTVFRDYKQHFFQCWKLSTIFKKF